MYRTKSLLEGSTALCGHFGLPRFDLGLDGIVGPVCAAGTSQIFDPWLGSEYRMKHK